ncbi:hypothetical protein BJV78DRAFT_1139780 [Lactifluus subvellereus]|nr:hypothetical protein BJV78DRAFT_1139780 [Lactifluus subvellereus]
MSTSGSSISECKPSEDPNPPHGTSSSTLCHPIYQTEMTGNYWGDVCEALKVHYCPPLPSFFTMWEGGDPQHARTDPFVASNWAVGTFMLVSLRTWTICQHNIHEERGHVQTVVEQLPKRILTKPKDSEMPQ